MAKSKFLSIMVIGNEPDKLMAKYDKALKVEPYVKYRYLDAKKLRNDAIKILSEIVANPDKLTLNSFQVDYFKERLKAVNGMTPFEYYSTITHGLYYDENGDALSEENPNGKWDKYMLGRNFSYPLKLKDGREIYQASAKDIDWDSMHMNHEYVRLFQAIWELVMEDAEPNNKQEKDLKDNWITKKNYLSNFKTKDDFVSHNCAYWNYAFLDENGWLDMDGAKDEKEWINNFYERFISNLKDDDLVTIYEYSIATEED